MSRTRAQRRYALSEKGRAMRQRYALSKKGRTARRRYFSTEEGRAARRIGESRRRAKWRARVLETLGGKCVRCGFNDDPRALQIDHKAGGGAAERRLFRTNGVAWLRRVLTHLEKYQLLCANCNWIKRCERGEHGSRGDGS